MRPSHIAGIWLSILFLSVSLAAQGHPSGSTGGGGHATGSTGGSLPTRSAPPSVNTPALSTPIAMFLSGKVKLDDGSELTDAAMIETICNGDRHFEAYTDRKGNFSFEFGKDRNIGNGDVSTTSRNLPGRPMSAQEQRRELQECELIAVLPGFTSQAVELAALDRAEAQSGEVGTIVLHPLAHTISATTAMAPSKAKKAYEKGRDQEQKRKWQAAEKKFQEAAQIYPKFAAAWLELGRVQIATKDVAGARHSLQQAVAADPQFVSPHQVLAALDFQQQHWQDVVEESGAVLRLNPLSFPQDWYYSSVAHYYLGQYEPAEKSARQGIQADVDHQIPRLEYLLGVILAQKRDYQGAMAHMRNYVRLAPKAADVPQVNQQIATIEKLSSSASTQSTSPK